MENQNQNYRPPKTVKTLYQQIKTHYFHKDSKNLALTFKELYFGNSYQTLTLESWNINIKIASDYSQLNDAVTSHFIKILEFIKIYEACKKSKQWQTAFDTHLKIVVQCLELIKQIKQINFLWILKPMRILIRATKKIFLESMEHITSSKLKNDLINTLNRFKSTRSLLEQVRAEIIPLIENMQVSILFNFHNYEMIKMIVYAPKISWHNSQNKFRDNFLFLKAKYALVNQKFKEAEQYFEMINLRTPGQKRLVLKYLIPCKIFLGKMFEPKQGQQDEYFPEYESLIKALKNASFKNFDSAIQKYQKVWIKRGIYLLMDRLRVLIWRNLIKRVYNALGEKIMFQKIQKAVKMAGGEQNINECICIIGNLIYEGYVKGIIYQNDKVRGLILKKQKCFPKLSDIIS